MLELIKIIEKQPQNFDRGERKQQFEEVLSKIDVYNKNSLECLKSLFKAILDNAADNKMTAERLSISIGPSLR